MKTVVAVLFFSAFAFAQHEHATSGHDHHGGFMSGSESAPHQVASGTSMKVSEGADAQGPFMTVRLGPLNLKAHSDHMVVAQMPERMWEVPITGWFTGYAPRLVNGKGEKLPGRMLHHIALWNTNRSDFLCTNKEEHLFGAGGEMNQWPVLPGVGYWVEKGDKIRVDTMFHNPTDTNHPDVYLEFDVRYATPDKAKLRNVYPAWFDVQECGNSGYDLAAGESKTRGTVAVNHTGRLIGVGGHMHDYGTGLVLSRGEEEIAGLPATSKPNGELESMPIVNFMGTGGYVINKGDKLTTAAAYNNRAGKVLPQGAMGIVVGYFLPDDSTEMAQYVRKNATVAGK